MSGPDKLALAGLVVGLSGLGLALWLLLRAPKPRRGGMLDDFSTLRRRDG